MKKKIAIIGSGIAGLTFANLIKKNSNFEFILYEKEESLSLEEGYGIQLSPNSIKILNQIDFKKKVNNRSIYNPEGVDFYNIKNEKICNLNFSQINKNDSYYTTLQRSTLIEFLRSDVYTQHLRFGKRIKEINEIKGKILIKFDDNTNDLVDFVVAADGIFSNTRTFFEKNKNKPKFKNAIAVRKIFKSRLEVDINEKNISLMMGKNCHLVIYPVNKNNEFNLVCIIRGKNYDPDNIKSLIDQKVINQNINLKSIFDGDLKAWPLYFTPNILPSKNNKVFYIGDAFNGFLPTLAQGASQSIESAFELSNILNSHQSDAQNSYFQKRSKRAKIIKKRSNFNFFAFHLSSPVTQAIRNFFMRFLVKRKSFLNFYLGIVYRN